MTADEALAELVELLPAIQRAVLADAGGSVLAATAGAGARAEELARRGRELLDDAAAARPGGPAVAHVEVRLPGGSVVAVREGGYVAIATLVPEPTSALILYDLRTCLRRLAEGPPPRRRRVPRKDAGA